MDEGPYRDGAPATAEPLYQEKQRFRQIWLWLLLAATMVLVAISLRAAFAAVASASRAAPAALSPSTMIAIAGGVLGGVALLLAGAELQVRVLPGWLEVRFRPFHLRPRHVAIASLDSFEACTFSPLGDYGGWGLRGFGDHRCYTVSGDRGVRLRFKDGKTLMIGSLRAEELADALRRARAT